MNILLKLISSVLVVTLSCIVTLLLAQPLIGLRGAPWFNFYVFEMPLVWAITTLVVAYLLSRGVVDWSGVFISSWIRGGGFWAIWSKSNIPGNTWIVITLLLIINAFTYGLPDPKVDWDRLKYDAQVSAQNTLQQPPTQNIISGVKGAVNYLAVGFLGVELIPGKAATMAAEVELLPRYQKGWWRILAALIAILITPLIWIWGRRNDLADKISSLVDVFKEKRTQRGSATSDNSSASNSFSGLLVNKLLKQTDSGGQVFNHMIGEFLSRLAETLFGAFAKLMKRY